jgi:carboxylate-amine ligase
VVASAGTHPFSRYEHQEVTDRPRYVELMAAMQWVAARELIFGLHVHVGIGHPEQAIAVANGLRCWLPELLALSANSPFWQGFDTGLSSARSKVFDSFPRSGLPPHFASWADFEELVTRAAATNCFPDATYLWWDVRPHPKFGTIEVRVCDGQSRIESVAGLVALVQSTAAWLAEEWEGGKRRGGQPRTLVAENKWRAARYGLDCDLVDLQHDEEIPAAQAVRRLLDRVADHASRLGCAAELAEVERLLERGNGAAEQRHVYDETHSLLAVAQHLVKQTLADI